MPGAAVVSEFVGQAALLCPVDVHVVNFEIAVAGRRKHDLLTISRDRAFGIVASRRREPLQVCTVGFGGEDVVCRINRPDVTFRSIGRRRAIGRAEMGGGIDDALSIGREITASRAALAGTDQLHVRSVTIHRKHLIAFIGLTRRLEDDLLAVEGKIRFRIFAADRSTDGCYEGAVPSGAAGSTAAWQRRCRRSGQHRV